MKCVEASEGVRKTRYHLTPRMGFTIVAAEGVNVVQADHEAAAGSPEVCPEFVTCNVTGEAVPADVQWEMVRSKK